MKKLIIVISIILGFINIYSNEEKKEIKLGDEIPTTIELQQSKEQKSAEKVDLGFDNNNTYLTKINENPKEYKIDELKDKDPIKKMDFFEKARLAQDINKGYKIVGKEEKGKVFENINIANILLCLSSLALDYSGSDKKISARSGIIIIASILFRDFIIFDTFQEIENYENKKILEMKSKLER